MIKKKENRILRNNIKNSIIIKYIYINTMLKSIFQNRNVNNKKRLFSNFNQKKIKQKTTLNNYCLINGQSNGLNKHLSISRHKLNGLAKLGLINNFKIKSW
jgi:ribosomal protein S14